MIRFFYYLRLIYLTSSLKFLFNFHHLLHKVKILNWLISHGANVDQTDHINGNTALFYAVYSKSIGVVKWLLNNSASHNIKNRLNETPLQIAIQIQAMDIGNILILNGARGEIIPSLQYTRHDE